MDFASFKLGTFLDAGVASIRTDHVFLTMLQFVAPGNICNVGRRPRHAVYQARFVINTDMRLHAKVILVTFWVWYISGSRLPYLFLIEQGALICVASTMALWDNSNPQSPR
jgi:hypothetical protein